MKQVWVAEKRRRSHEASLFKKQREKRRLWSLKKKQRAEEEEKLQEICDILAGVSGLLFLYYSEQAKKRIALFQCLARV